MVVAWACDALYRWGEVFDVPLEQIEACEREINERMEACKNDRDPAVDLGVAVDVRHEALSNRAVVKGHRLWPVAVGG